MSALVSQANTPTPTFMSRGEGDAWKQYRIMNLVLKIRYPIKSNHKIPIFQLIFIENLVIITFIFRDLEYGD